VVSTPQGTYPKAYQRFRGVSDHFAHRCEFTYGLIRADVLQCTRLQLNYTDSDRTLMSELSLRGRFYEIPEVLFYKRYHFGNDAYWNWSGHMKWFLPDLNEEKAVFPYCMQFMDYLTTLSRVELSIYEKMRCYMTLAAWPVRNRRGVARELIYGVIMLMRSGIRRTHARSRHEQK
jgi:hypothetical protein